MTKKFFSGFSLGFSKYFQKNRSYFYAKDNRALKYSILASVTFILGLLVGVYLAPISLSFANTDISVELTDHSHTEYSKLSITEKNASTLAASRRTLSTISQSSSSKASTLNLNNKTSTASSIIEIPSINLSVALTPSVMQNKELSVPDYGVSYYNTLYMGHRSGVFKNLPSVKAGEIILINKERYVITAVEHNLPVANNRQSVGQFTMRKLTNLASGQIVLMTCAGNYETGFGWNARTLVFATKI